MKKPKTARQLMDILKIEYYNYCKTYIHHQDDEIDFLDWLDEIYVSTENREVPIYGWLIKKNTIRDLQFIKT